jgi:hypothetical protein
MPIFELERDGQTFEVEAPDMQTAVQAVGIKEPPKIHPPVYGADDKPLDQEGMVERYNRKPPRQDNSIVGVAQRAFSDPVGELGAQTARVATEYGMNPAMAERLSRDLTRDLPASLGPLGAMDVGVAPATVRAPTRDALRDAGGAGYDLARGSNVALRGDVVNARARAIQVDLRRKGFYDTSNNAPTTYAILRDLETGGNRDGAVLTAGDYINARQALQEQAKNINSQEGEAASYAIKDLDKLFDTANTRYFSSGTPSEIRDVRQAIKDARSNFAAQYRSDKITGREHAAELRSQAANSGKNFDNTARQQLTGLALNKNAIRGYSPEEVKAIEGFAEGSRARNFTRRASNVMGGGGGLGASVWTIPGALTSLATGDMKAAMIGVGVPAAGAAIKTAENALTRRDLKKLDETIRSRSALSGAMRDTQEMAAQPFTEEEVLRLLYLYQLQHGGQ